ncbi:serine/threonine protein kinase [Hyalangium versicolor]|uniref:serine/threonine protein kinase n=1 Tax=Hyalangium versicolor TaxID=2861190 RepID=UPI001CC905DA|nr:serine/threonine-protein kinase [Hyalangium versicolor]
MDEVNSLVGQRHGPLIFERLLGLGAVGAVYLTMHPPTGARFTVKVLHPPLAASSMVRTRFYVEAQAASRVIHRNVARVLDARPGPGGQPCVLMEYVEGDPLSTLPLPMPPAEATALLIQVLEGLEAAHARGVVHCDLKPDNIVITRDKQGQRLAKVLDFGMASVLSACFSPEELAAGVSLGSPSYMAPEQWETTAADTRMDVYALGVIGYRLLTGRLPFGRGRMTEVLLHQQEQRPPAPHTLDSRIPPVLSMVLMQAIARRPEERFPSARDFQLALIAAQRRIPRPTMTLQAVAPRVEGPSGLQVRVGGLGSPEPRSVRASDVTAEGLFIAFEGAPPPLAARLPLELSFQGRSVICAGDVVRHVSQDEALGWGVSAGFFVHFTEPSEALSALVAQARDGASEPLPDPELAQLLARTAALGKDPYVFLGLPPSASFDEVRQRSEAAYRRVETFWGRTIPQSQRRDLEMLRARVEAARRTLGDPLTRAGYDASKGNAHGIARCIAAGLTEQAVDPMRRAYLSARPGAEARAHAFFVQARNLEAQHSLKAALDCYAQALALDPLNIAGQRHYWALQRRMRPMTMSLPAIAR